MKLEHLFSYNAEVEGQTVIGQGNMGLREIFPVKGGEVWGPKISGRILPIGGEFQVSDETGRIRLDVRIVIETDDNVPIYMQYNGIFDLTEDVRQLARSKGGTEYGEAYWVTRPILESGHEKYNWVNGIVCVGEGRVLGPGKLEYRVYQCLPSND